MKIIDALWAFCSYLFWPQWGRFKTMVSLILPLCGWAQEYCGTTGLIAVPTAEMAETGTFRGGAFFMNKQFTPDMLVCDGEKYNTGGYCISFVPFSWVEVSYACTLLKYHKNNIQSEPTGYYNEDRRLSVKFRPLKEGKWWPAIAIGADDVEQFAEKWLGHHGGTYYHNAYAIASKHFDLKGNELSAHLGYRYFFKDMNKKRRGIAGGIALRPRFYSDLRFMADWDGECVNMGADVLLWKHFYVQAGLTNGKYLVGGMSYHYTIKY